MLSILPLFFKTISYFIYKKKRGDQNKDDATEENEENNQEEPKTYVITEDKWEFLWQAPFISVIKNFILLKELIRVKDEKDEVKVDAKIQNFRLYQIYCGSIPIIVCKMASLIHDQENVDLGIESMNKITNITSMSTLGLIFTQDIILFSMIGNYLAISIKIAENFIYMPIFLKTDLTRNKILHQTKKSYLFIIPLTILIFTPRFLSLTLLFSVWRGIGCFLIFAGAVTIYTLGFALLIYTKYKKEWKENSFPLIQSFFTSFFTPCIIMYPESQLIFWASLVSTLPHLFLISALLFMANHYPDELCPKLAAEGFYFLIPCILIAPVFSWLMHSYSQEKTQKILLGALSFKLLKFFLLSIVLCALDELTDILAAMDYFR